MCIRDRHSFTLIRDDGTEYKTPFEELACVKAVSYTHLDVYKRQVLRMMNGKKNYKKFIRLKLPIRME